MVKELTLNLLGSPRVSYNEEPITDFITNKAAALLYYLAMTGRVHTRLALAGLLWPDVPDTVARKNLRDILSNLRKLVGGHLVITRHTVMFDVKQPHTLDTAQIDLATENSLDRYNIAQLQSAVDLYQGEFLEGFHIRNADPFDEWLFHERERLHTSILHILHLLAAHYVDIGGWNEGLQITQRILMLEPWNEAAHRQQMRLFMGSGNRSAALQQYDHCKRILATEFQVEPTAETQVLNELIRTDSSFSHLAQSREANSDSSTMIQQSNNRADHRFDGQMPENREQNHQHDLQRIPSPPNFIGRQQELTTLATAMTDPKLRLVTVLGLGGQGKTALVAHFATTLLHGAEQQRHGRNRQDKRAELSAPFTRVIWYSCKNAEPLRHILLHCLKELGELSLTMTNASLQELQHQFLTSLQQTACLLVFDNFENYLTLEQDEDRGREEWRQVEKFFQAFVSTAHPSTTSQREYQSKFILISREQPASHARYKEQPSASLLQLHGMRIDDAIQLLQACQISGKPDELVALARRYSGHPLALKIMAEVIDELFAGDITTFLQEDPLIFDDIRNLLKQQFARLSTIELEIIFWLAITRNAMTPQQIWDDLYQPPPRNQFFEAIRSLQHKSLVEAQEQPKRFTRQVALHLTLPTVVLEYAIDSLIHEICQELQREQFLLLTQYALLKAQAPDYIREIQKKFLLQPIARRMQRQWGITNIEQRFDYLISLLQMPAGQKMGYATANLLHLMQQMNIDLSGKNLSGLYIRQADFRRTQLIDTNLSGTEFAQCAFADYFGGVLAVAFSPDNTILAAATTDGDIYIWRTNGGQFLGICRGNGRWLWSLAFSPDGQHLLSGSGDRQLRIWDISDFYHISPATPTTGIPLRTLVGHTDAVFSVVYSPDGKFVASGSADGTIRIWHAGDGLLVQTIDAHSAAIFAVAFDPSCPDGRRLASASRDQMIRLWDTTSGEQLQQFVGHQDEIISLAFLPNGSALVSGSWDQTVRVWSVSTGQVMQIWQEAKGPVLAVACDVDNDTIAAAGNDHTIYLWSLHTGRLKFSIQGHFRAIGALAFAGDGRTLASGSFDQTVRLWDQEDGHPICSYYGYAHHIHSLKLNRDGSMLLSGNVDNAICLWDMERLSPNMGRLLARREPREHWPSQTIYAKNESIFCLDIHPLHNLLAYAGDNGMIQLRDLNRADQYTRKLYRNNETILSLAFSPDGEWLASGTEDRKILLWDLRHDHCVRVFLSNTNLVETILFAQDGNYLFAGNYDGTVSIWPIPKRAEANPETDTSADVLPFKQLNANSTGQHIAMQQRLATVHGDVVDSTEITVERPRHSLQTTTNGVNALAMDHTGQLLAIGGANPHIEIWRRSGTEGRCSPSNRSPVSTRVNGAHLNGDEPLTPPMDLYALYYKFNVVTSTFALAFSADGRFLASGGGDKQIYIWDLVEARQVQVLSGHRGTIRSLIFAKHGQQLYSSGEDKEIRVWTSVGNEWFFEKTLCPPAIYQGMNLYGVTGLHVEKRVALRRLGASEEIGPPSTDKLPHNLPRMLTPFYGRETEQLDLLKRISEPETQLITIWGEGGVGKSRLVVEAAHALAATQLPEKSQATHGKVVGEHPVHWQLFSDGIWWIALNETPANEQIEDSIAATIGKVLNIVFGHDMPLRKQLIERLQDKKLLLVLDGFDKHMAAAAFLLTLLQNAPHVKMIVTSRHRLDLLAQRCYRLHGLATPSITAAPVLSDEELLTYSGIQLFVERAERVLGQFVISSENRDDLLQLCQLLGGLPLGLELAATQIQHRSLAEIVQAVRTDLATIAATVQDLPEHQRNLEMVLAYSFANIDLELQQILISCTVFHHDFDSVAASNVVLAKPAQLCKLRDHSLLYDRGDKRYSMHEFVRIFMHQQIGNHAHHETVHKRHADYYLTLLQTHGMRATSTVKDLERLRCEIENIRAAWHWTTGKIASHMQAESSAASFHQAIELLQQSVSSFFYLYERLGYHTETEELIAQALAILNCALSYMTADLSATDQSQAMEPAANAAQREAAPIATESDTGTLLAQLKVALLIESASYSALVGKKCEFQGALAEASTITQQLTMPTLEARIYHLQAISHQEEGEFDEARGCMLRMETIARQHHLLEWQIAARNLRGIFSDMQGDRLRAMEQYRIALPLAVKAGDIYQEKLLVNNMGLVALGIGEWDQAKSCFERNLVLSETLGNPARHAFALMNHALLLDAVGLYEEAERGLKAALELARSMRHRQAEIYTLQFLSQLGFHTGNNTLARKCAEESLVLIEQFGQASMKAQGITLLAHNFMVMGEKEEAFNTYAQAINLWRSMDNQLEVYLARAGYAYVVLQMGKIDEAMMVVTDILAVFDDILEQKITNVGWIAISCLYVLRMAKDPRAEEMLQKTYRYIQTQASQISDRRMRDSFLNNIFPHRMIIRFVQNG